MVLEELLEEEEEEGEAMGTVLGMVPVLDLDDPGVFKLDLLVGGVAEYPWALLRESGSHSPFFWVGIVDLIGTGLLEEEVDDLRVAADFLVSSMLSLKNYKEIVNFLKKNFANSTVFGKSGKCLVSNFRIFDCSGQN